MQMTNWHACASFVELFFWSKRQTDTHAHPLFGKTDNFMLGWYMVVGDWFVSSWFKLCNHVQSCAIMCNPQSHGCSHQAIDKFSRISRRDVTGIIPKRPSKFGFDFGEKLGESWAKMIQKWGYQLVDLCLGDVLEMSWRFQWDLTEQDWRFNQWQRSIYPDP